MKTFKSTLWTSIFVVVWSMAPTMAVAQANQREEEIPAPQSASLPANSSVPQPSAGSLKDNDASRPDPSGRVARLQYMAGSVSVQPRGTEEWALGSLNRPLTTADNVWADKDSRAELSLGSAVLRLGAESSLTLTNVTYEAVQLQLHQGTLNVHVRRLFSGEIYEIDTPNQAFTILKAGDYRFDVDSDGAATVVTVRRGKGVATGGGAGVQVKSGQQVRFTGGTSLQHVVYEAPRRDGFDDWCWARDKRLDHSYSARYVGAGTVGYEDLDEYGSWRDDSEYGHIWTPRHVVAGWSPYHYGHWIWVEPWGWTWEDDAPWGFAPFHYGRWAYTGGYWGWVPGPYYARPYYAPALVVWFGGPRWGWDGFGGGVGFGWCALGWREPYYPSYYGSRQYFQNVNITNTHITNITNITNNYYNNHMKVEPVRHPVNFDRPGGFTAVSRNTIVNSQPVAKNATHIPADVRRNIPTLRKVEVEPSRESRLGVHADQRAAGAPQGVLARPTVNKLPPPVMPERGRGFGGPQTMPVRPVVGKMGEEGNRGRIPVARGPMGNGTSSGPVGAGPGGNGRAGNGPTRIDHANGSPNGTDGRFVPRPPSAGNGGPGRGVKSVRGVEPVRDSELGQRGGQRNVNNGVPRPPVENISRPVVTSGGPGRGGYNIDRSNGGGSNGGRVNVDQPNGGRPNVDRPNGGGPVIDHPYGGRPNVDEPSGRRPVIDHPYGGRPSVDSPNGRSNTVPRPEGPVRPAPRDYSEPSYRGAPSGDVRGGSPRGNGGYRPEPSPGPYSGSRSGEGPRDYGRGGGDGGYNRGSGGGYHPRELPPNTGGGPRMGGGDGGGRPQGGGVPSHSAPPQGGGGRAPASAPTGGHEDKHR